MKLISINYEVHLRDLLQRTRVLVNTAVGSWISTDGCCIHSVADSSRGSGTADLSAHVQRGLQH